MRSRRVSTMPSRWMFGIVSLSILVAIVGVVRSVIHAPAQATARKGIDRRIVQSDRPGKPSSTADPALSPEEDKLAEAPADPQADAGPFAASTTLSPNMIHFRSRTYVPEPTLTVPPGNRPGLTRRHFLVQYDKSTEATINRLLAERGIQVLQAVPPNAVSVSAPLDANLEGLHGLRAAFALLPEDRLSEAAARMVAQVPEPHASLPLFIEFHGDVTAAEATETLSSLGINPGPQPEALPSHVVRTYVSADLVQRLSEEEMVAWIIPSTESLMSSEQVHYCPGAETAVGVVASFVVGNDGWDGPGLGSADLTYYWDTALGRPFNSPASEAQLRAEIVRALGVWTRYVQISFAESAINNENRCFSIYAGTGDHGDSYPFTPEVLAHCFYPTSHPLGGDMHFNNAFTFEIGHGNDLFSIALHEAGHGLGLDHSADPNSVMYPSYHGVVSDLTQDDINGIRQIYATRIAGSTAPTGLVPAGGAQVNSSVSFSWTPVPGATSYSVWLGSGTAASYQAVTTLSATTNSISYTPTSNGPYVWWVQAVDGSGSGAWSAPAEFTFSSNLPAPGQIIGLTPNGTSWPGLSVTFDWGADANATSYTIWIGSGTPGNYTFSMSQIVATNRATLSLADAGAYVWWVRGSNASSAGPWSNAATVTITGGALTAPANLSPTAGAVVSNPVVTLSWDATPGAAAGYDVWLASGTPTSFQYFGGATSWQNTMWSTTLAAPGSYVWWVRARSGSATGPWSAAASFTYGQSSSVPSAITGLSPNGASVPGGTATLNLSWTADASATSYTVWVGTGTPASYTFSSSTTVSQASATITLGGTGSYVWWVRGHSPAGSGPWSAAATFTVSSGGTLTAPQGLTPGGGSIVSGGPVTLGWSVVSGASSYDVWVGTGTAANYQYLTSGTVTSLGASVALSSSGPYVWWVRARSGSTVGPWSTASQFSYSSP